MGKIGTDWGKDRGWGRREHERCTILLSIHTQHAQSLDHAGNTFISLIQICIVGDRWQFDEVSFLLSGKGKFQMQNYFYVGHIQGFVTYKIFPQML